jgi:hypothetical protein
VTGRGERGYIWLDGGWGVDALVGEQTREHEDLNLIVRDAHGGSTPSHDENAHGLTPRLRELFGNVP